MKYLVVLLVVAVAAWVVLGRSRGRADRRRAAQSQAPAKPDAAAQSVDAGAAQAMIACSHCGLHVPRGDAVADAQGRLFCEHAHRLAGPR